MVNRGYSSQTAMFDSANRFIRADRAGKKCHLLYLGDHDPSGEDMVRDIGERLEMFGANVEIEKLALKMAQVNEHNPPPNPAKLSDSRAGGYIATHGKSLGKLTHSPAGVTLDSLQNWESARSMPRGSGLAYILQVIQAPDFTPRIFPSRTQKGKPL